MHEIVAQDFEITSSGVGPDVGVPRGVLNGAVVRLPRVGLVHVVNAFALVLGDEAKIHEENVILFRPESADEERFSDAEKKLNLNFSILPPVTQQQILGLDVVVNIALAMNVLEDIDDLDRQVESRLDRKELLSVLEDFLEIFAVPIHDEESVLVAFEGVGA